MLLGAHESISGGVYKALERGEEDTCDCVQIFTASPRIWSSKEFDEEEVEKWHELLKELNIRRNVSHCSYLLNAAHTKESQRSKSVKALIQELHRCERLGLIGAVIHPGSNPDEEERVANIITSFNEVIAETSDLSARIIIENTAGAGNKAGASFEEIRSMIKGVNESSRLGVCFDTCHAYSAGHDLVNDYDKVMDEFEDVIGVDKLVCLHLNDSKHGLNSHKDRHEDIGRGEIGESVFKKLVNDERFENIPGYLETPGGGASYKKNLQVLRGLIKE